MDDRITYALLQMKTDVVHGQVLFLLLHPESNLIEDGKESTLERLNGLKFITNHEERLIEALNAHLNSGVEL